MEESKMMQAGLKLRFYDHRYTAKLCDRFEVLAGGTDLLGEY